MIKLFDFLRRKPELTHEEFCAYWRDVHAPLVLGAPGVAGRVRRYVQNRAIPGAAIPELTLSDFDGVDELWFDSLDDLASALDAPRDRDPIEASVERFADARSAIRLAAEEAVQFDRGFGSVKFIGLSRRHPELSHEEWCRYWIDVHGPLAHGVPEFTRYYGKYVHNYVLPSDLGSLGQAPLYDGIVEEWLESVEEMARCLSEPKYLEVVRPDELRFVDFARSHMLLTEEHVIWDGRGSPSAG